MISFERTLTVLADKYEKDFVKFLGESIKKWKQNPHGLRHVAFDLYMLTYRKYDLYKTAEFFKSNTQEPYIQNGIVLDTSACGRRSVIIAKLKIISSLSD